MINLKIKLHNSSATNIHLSTQDEFNSRNSHANRWIYKSFNLFNLITYKESSKLMSSLLRSLTTWVKLNLSFFITMPVEFYILVIPFCVIPVFLISLDYINQSAALKRSNYNVIDFDKFIKHKEEGDAVDSDIARLLDIDKIAA